MEQGDYTLALSELKPLARPHGVRITPAWLAKYARAGLLPVALPSPGLGRGKGRSPARYPPQMHRHLRAFLELRERHGKNLSAIGWNLWKLGFSVDDKYGRGRLERAAATWTRIGSFIRNGAAAAFVKRLLRRRNAGPFIGGARRALPPNHVGNLLELMFSVISGEDERISQFDYDPGESQFERKLFGRALTIPECAQKAPIDVKAFDDILFQISQFAQKDPVKWLSTISDDEIRKAQQELFGFADALNDLSKQADENVCRALALRLLTRSFSGATIEAVAILIWLGLRRRPGAATRIRELTAQIRGFIPNTDREFRDGSVAQCA